LQEEEAICALLVAAPNNGAIGQVVQKVAETEPKQEPAIAAVTVVPAVMDTHATVPKVNNVVYAIIVAAVMHRNPITELNASHRIAVKMSVIQQAVKDALDQVVQ
jgi:hypothetical protein